jgi:hypothetical protein
MTDDLTLFKAFVSHEEATVGFKNWARDNCGAGRTVGGLTGSVARPLIGTDLMNWYTYRDKVKAGVLMARPPMKTLQGFALLDAAEMGAPEGVIVVPPPVIDVSKAYFSEDAEDGMFDTSVVSLWSKEEKIVANPWKSGGKAILMPTTGSTVSSGAPNSQMSAIWLNYPYSRGSQGQKVAYRYDMGIPADYKPTVGQWNTLGCEHHISDRVPQNTSDTKAASCAYGFWSYWTDANTGIQYGEQDFPFVARMMGGDYRNPYGSGCERPWMA